MRPKLSRDLLVYGVGEVVVKAFGLITLPIYTRVFSPEQYGALSVVLTLGGLFMAIVALGGDSAYVRYFLSARTFEERRLVTSTWIGFLAIWGVVAAFALVPLAPVIARAAIGVPGEGELVAIALLLTPVRLTNLMCAQILRNEFRAGSYTILNVAALALMVVCSLFAAITLGLGVLGVLLGTLVAELLMLPVRIATARHMLGLHFSPAVLRRLLAFGVPLVPASLAYWIFTTSDRVLLSNLSSLQEVGLYQVAASIVGLTSIAVTALGQAWSPHAVLAYEADADAAGRLFGRMLTYILAGFGVLAVGLSAFAHEIVDALTADEYAFAAMGVAPLAIGVVAYASTQVTAGGISLTKRTGFLAAYSWLAAIINLVLCVILIPPFGMVGAAWATAAAYLALTLAYLVTSHRLWPIAYEHRRTLTTIALTLLFIFGAYLLPLPPPNLESGLVLDIMLKALYCVAFVSALFAAQALDRRELAMITRALRVVTANGR